MIIVGNGAVALTEQNCRRDINFYVSTTIRTTFVAIVPYLILFTSNTLRGMDLIKLAGEYSRDTFAPLDYMYGYPIMMTLITPAMDILYRKTKSIWPGVIVCVMLLGY